MTSFLQNKRYITMQTRKTCSIAYVRFNRILKEVLKHLLVDTFEVTSVMATIFKQQGHVNITLQFPTTHVHHLSGWLPFHSLLLHNWTIGRKAHPIEDNLIFKTARFRQADERRARFTIKCTRLCEDTKNILSNLYMYCINKR